MSIKVIEFVLRDGLRILAMSTIVVVLLFLGADQGIRKTHLIPLYWWLVVFLVVASIITIIRILWFFSFVSKDEKERRALQKQIMTTKELYQMFCARTKQPSK